MRVCLQYVLRLKKTLKTARAHTLLVTSVESVANASLTTEALVKFRVVSLQKKVNALGTGLLKISYGIEGKNNGRKITAPKNP